MAVGWNHTAGSGIPVVLAGGVEIRYGRIAAPRAPIPAEQAAADADSAQSRHRAAAGVHGRADGGLYDVLRVAEPVAR